MANTVSVGAAFCLVTMLLCVQAAHAQPAMAPMGSPMYAPEMAPMESPMYAPEMAPEMTPVMAPEMTPMMAPPAYSPTTPGPAVINAMTSSASSNVVSGAAVLVGFAAFFLY